MYTFIKASEYSDFFYLTYILYVQLYTTFFMLYPVIPKYFVDWSLNDIANSICHFLYIVKWNKVSDLLLTEIDLVLYINLQVHIHFTHTF